MRESPFALFILIELSFYSYENIPLLIDQSDFGT